MSISKWWFCLWNQISHNEILWNQMRFPNIVFIILLLDSLNDSIYNGIWYKKKIQIIYRVKWFRFNVLGTHLQIRHTHTHTTHKVNKFFSNRFEDLEEKRSMKIQQRCQNNRCLPMSKCFDWSKYLPNGIENMWRYRNRTNWL